MDFSIIIPVYNRPDEVEELLESLTEQEYPRFEVVIVEDGSQEKCDKEVAKYQDRLDIAYFFKENTGPGTTRNYGAERAKYDYLIFFDSDCIIPSTYLKNVASSLTRQFVDAYGGPDMAHTSFTNLQKAINYSMTSFLTTGGIRGGAKSMEKFKPRSFNMGYSREVFKRLGGFSTMRFGEDIDMSLRILGEGFTTQLIREAGVYHKRRTDFKKFYKQVYNSGIARINLFVRYPRSLKTVHLLPALFVLGLITTLIASLFAPSLLVLPVLLAALFFADALRSSKSFEVAGLAIIASYIQLVAYGIGFLQAAWKRLLLKDEEFHAFRTNFYK